MCPTFVCVGERGRGSGVYRGGGGHQVQPGVRRTPPRGGTGHDPPGLVEQGTIQVGQEARIQGIFDGFLTKKIFVANFLLQKIRIENMLAIVCHIESF